MIPLLNTYFYTIFFICLAQKILNLTIKTVIFKFSGKIQRSVENLPWPFSGTRQGFKIYDKFPHWHTFQHKGFSIVVAKLLIPPLLTAVTSFLRLRVIGDNRCPTEFCDKIPKVEITWYTLIGHETRSFQLNLPPTHCSLTLLWDSGTIGFWWSSYYTFLFSNILVITFHKFRSLVEPSHWWRILE